MVAKRGSLVSPGKLSGALRALSPQGWAVPCSQPAGAHRHAGGEPNEASAKVGADSPPHPPHTHPQPLQMASSPLSAWAPRRGRGAEGAPPAAPPDAGAPRPGRRSDGGPVPGFSPPSLLRYGTPPRRAARRMMRRRSSAWDLIEDATSFAGLPPARVRDYRRVFSALGRGHSEMVDARQLHECVSVLGLDVSEVSAPGGAAAAGRNGWLESAASLAAPPLFLRCRRR